MLTLTSGELILVLRKRRGFTQAQLACVSGVSRVLINSIENGHRTPRPAVLEGIADALQVPVALVAGESAE
jgi:transcriptional regulator with XRE-family HTH domain